LESAVTIPEEDSHRTISAVSLTHGGDIRDTILVEVGDKNATGENSCRISDRRLKGAIAITKQHPHGACDKVGVSRCNISESISVQIGDDCLGRSARSWDHTSPTKVMSNTKWIERRNAKVNTGCCVSNLDALTRNKQTKASHCSRKIVVLRVL